MKKNSTKNRLKRAAILASLIFGSLVLTACPNVFGNNGSGNGNGAETWTMKSEDIQKISILSKIN